MTKDPIRRQALDRVAARMREGGIDITGDTLQWAFDEVANEVAQIRDRLAADFGCSIRSSLKAMDAMIEARRRTLAWRERGQHGGAT